MRPETVKTVFFYGHNAVDEIKRPWTDGIQKIGPACHVLKMFQVCEWRYTRIPLVMFGHDHAVQPCGSVFHEIKFRV
ncbi:hypothetical protein ASG65_26175 [Bacillus sp. Leaf13]|nr:hypothetical protein ASG65_26175 [Bacillus sp. Leaf13]